MPKRRPTSDQMHALADAAGTQALAQKIAQMPTADVALFLGQFNKRPRAQLITNLLAAGADATKLAEAVRDLTSLEDLRRRRAIRITLWLLGLASGTASAFHGYRRNENVGAAIGWFVAGTFVPPVTLAVAAAQGFGRRRTR
jgi:hypothetical protein